MLKKIPSLFISIICFITLGCSKDYSSINNKGRNYKVISNFNIIKNKQPWSIIKEKNPKNNEFLCKISPSSDFFFDNNLDRDLRFNIRKSKDLDLFDIKFDNGKFFKRGKDSTYGYGDFLIKYSEWIPHNKLSIENKNGSIDVVNLTELRKLIRMHEKCFKSSLPKYVKNIVKRCKNSMETLNNLEKDRLNNYSKYSNQTSAFWQAMREKYGKNIPTSIYEFPSSDLKKFEWVFWYANNVTSQRKIKKSILGDNKNIGDRKYQDYFSYSKTCQLSKDFSGESRY